MSNYNNFLFYGSWRETLEGFREDFGDAYAREALWNLMLMATAGDIETDKKSIIGFVQGACMPNIEAAQDRYERAQQNGQKGGRPSRLTLEDNIVIATMRKEGKKQIEIAKAFNVSADTIRRSEGWQNWQNYTAKQQNLLLNEQQNQQNPAKPGSKKQNLDIDIDIYREKEKDKEKIENGFDYLYDEVLSDGFLERKNVWIDNLDKNFYEKSRSAQCSFLENLGYTAPEANFILENILTNE